MRSLLFILITVVSACTSLTRATEITVRKNEANQQLVPDEPPVKKQPGMCAGG